MAPRFLLMLLLSGALSTSLVVQASSDDDDDFELPRVSERDEYDIEDELEDELEDRLEERLEAAEEREEELEDRIEEMLEAREDLEDELEDELEERLEKNLERLERISDERIERETERYHQLWEIEARVEDLEAFSVADEYIALLSEEELEAALAKGTQIKTTERLEGLGGYLVTFPDEVELEQTERNHIYTLDSATVSIGGDSVIALASMAGLTVPESTSAVIGMMDSSIDETHPCLGSVTLEQQAFYPAGAQPDTQHGTAIASVIGGACGVLSEVRLANAAVFGRGPEGLVVASAKSLIEGLNWLVEKQASVINLSLSGPRNRVLEQAVRQVAARNILLVASSGNEGAAAFPRYPAASPEVIAVTAVDHSMQVYPRAVRGPHIEFAAPGVGVQVAGPHHGKMTMDGTSVAAAFATSLLVIAISSGDSVDSLAKQAKDLGEPGRDNTYGYGLLTVDKKKASPAE